MINIRFQLFQIVEYKNIHLTLKHTCYWPCLPRVGDTVDIFRNLYEIVENVTFKDWRNPEITVGLKKKNKTHYNLLGDDFLTEYGGIDYVTAHAQNDRSVGDLIHYLGPRKDKLNPLSERRTEEKIVFDPVQFDNWFNK